MKKLYPCLCLLGHTNKHAVKQCESALRRFEEIQRLAKKYGILDRIVIDTQNVEDYGNCETDGQITLGRAFLELGHNEQRYVLLHEIAHRLTQNEGHTDGFYSILREICISESILGDIARSMEQVYPIDWGNW